MVSCPEEKETWKETSQEIKIGIKKVDFAIQ